MPFDAAIAISRPGTPSAVLEQNGLAPVPLELLAAHKQAQLRKFGPSFFYRHRGLLVLALIAPLIVLLATGAAAHSLSIDTPALMSWLIGGAVLVPPMLLAAGLVRLRAGAHWQERRLPASVLSTAGVPAPIAVVARRMQDELPGSALILGELVREHVVLDPYLLLVLDGEQACLGIWEDDTVIAQVR